MQSRLFLFVALSTGAGVPAAMAEPPPTAGVPVEAVAGGGPSKLHPALLRQFAGRAADHQVKAWVFFEDTKGFATDVQRNVALRDLRSTYHPRSAQRRRLRRTDPGLFDVRDLPVPTRYVEAVRALGVRVGVVSRWVNAASIWGTQRQLTEIARLPFVKELQPVRRGRKPDPVNIHDTGGVAAATESWYGESYDQLHQINLDALHDAGFTGAGVIVGILDTGFQRTHYAFNQPGHVLTVVAEHDFVDGDDNTAIEPGDPPGQHNHGTLILGALGAYLPNTLVGGAYNASFVLCKTEDNTSETPVEEDNYVAGLEFIEANGGDMATASLGYIDWYTQADLDGLTAVTTIAVNAATANGVHCCNAAGNGNHDADPLTSHLIAPADALKVLTCGAVDSADLIASFSSDGPSADGRVKPEVLARGVDTRTVSPSSVPTDVTVGANGTSLSTPLVASAVACLIEAHPDWTVDQMRRYLLYTAKDYVANHTYDPTYVRGYGIIDALAASAGDCNANLVPDATDIANATSEDCNTNGIPDECDIADGRSLDTNADGIPDECPPPPIPTMSTWGMFAAALALLGAGTIVLHRRGAKCSTTVPSR
ncbi:MAG: S8 family serine peptidase [Planctomycetota bacterium]